MGDGVSLLYTDYAETKPILTMPAALASGEFMVTVSSEAHIAAYSLTESP